MSRFFLIGELGRAIAVLEDEHTDEEYTEDEYTEP
jgi:hypothetical protein